MSWDHHHDHHDHHHEHHPDHPHSPAEELAEGAFTLSPCWEGRAPEGRSLALLEEEAAAGILAAAGRLAGSGVFYGHIKALLEAEGWRTGFSLTRLGQVDRAWPDGPAPSGTVREWRLTLNVIALFPEEELTAEDFGALFPTYSRAK